jgi:hypothetical protein
MLSIKKLLIIEELNIVKLGGPGGTRTLDILLKRQTL